VTRLREQNRFGSRCRRAERGLTLIELSVALAIVAVLFAGVVMSVGALTGSKAKAAAGELGGVIRSLYDTAALSGKTCRLVFQIPAEKDENGTTRYWAECAAGNITTRRDRDEALRDEARAQEEKEKDKRRGGSSSRTTESSNSEEPSLQEPMAREKDRVDSAATYQEYTAPEISARELPGNVRVAVWTQHQKEAVKSGLAYLYFFPQGYTEKSMVIVNQGTNAWTLTVSPLTGKVSVVSEALEVPR
jgi:general secretion pathway protein H